MNENPYHPPSSSSDGSGSVLICQRRLDVSIITLVFTTAVIVSIVSIPIPELFAVLRPRFGFTLEFLLFPVVHLGGYLYRPAPKMLWGAAGMTAFVAILGGASVWWCGTTAVISDPRFELLPSACFFSVIPALAASIYIGSIAWSLRSREPYTSCKSPPVG